MEEPGRLQSMGSLRFSRCCDSPKTSDWASHRLISLVMNLPLTLAF